MFTAEGPPEHEILARLALGVGESTAGADASMLEDLLLDGALHAAVGREDSPLAGRSVEELRAIVTADESRTSPDHLLDVMVRTGAYGDWFGAVPGGLSLDALAGHPHGIDLGPLDPRLPGALRTTSGTIEVDHPAILDELTRLAARMEAGVPTEELVLIGRRHLRSNNSWMHNLDVLVRGRARCTLLVHPDDAHRLGLTDGALATIRSAVGQIEAPVELSDEMRCGVVSLPHGWGHDLPGIGLTVAAGHPGVNSNLLTDPERLDPLSGNAVLNGIPVRVEPSSPTHESDHSDR